jgi:hypothetical protein
VKGQEVGNLGKDGRLGIHRSLLAVAGQKSDNNTKMRPNRLRLESRVTYAICGGSKGFPFQRWDTSDVSYQMSVRHTR